MALQPIVNGLRLGALVEIKGADESLDGQLGQLVSFSRDTNKYGVALINGASADVDSSCVRTPENLKKPGTGGDEDSFDIFLGPQTQAPILAEEMAACIFEKGFCVIRVHLGDVDLEKTIEGLRALGDEGRLGRLPLEVEEGYLGDGGKGKVMWLDPEDLDVVPDEVIDAVDKNISFLGALLQGFSMDIVGNVLDERTPALVSLSLDSAEENDYPQPMASDKVLGDYMGTWKRGTLRLVHFIGPPIANVTLEAKEGPTCAALPIQHENISIFAPANTVLLFRTDCFSYKMEAPEEIVTVMASFLSPGPAMEFVGYEGDLKAFNLVGEGPPPPMEPSIGVMDINTRLASCWDSAGMMNTGLQAGCDTVVEIPVVRFDVNMYYCPDPDELLMGPPRTVQRHTSFVEGLELFDNKYFEISNNEAGGMGPLQRNVMEVGRGLLESQKMTKKTANREAHHAGVSVGVDKDDYPSLGIDTGSSAGGNALAIIANRFSFVFNLKGPNFICDTACSASLTAAHFGKLLLLERNYDPLEFHVAIGTHLCLSTGPFIGTSMSQMVSPQGRCFTFNASANGYLRGEGTSGMFMKHAANEDRIAIYRASNIGQDGRSASLTAPNGPAQEAMIHRAVKEARMTPPESTCWECHGTGTSLGDPIEVGAVRKVQIKMPRLEPLMMSTMKSNVGHLEGGAAMAGMVKCVLQAMYSQCLSSLHVGQLNAHLEHAAFDAFFETECTKFKYQQGHCQVTSLGFGGSNGHAIFWGKKVAGNVPTPYELIMQRIRKMAPAEVRVIGDNPDRWEADLPDEGSKLGDKYSIMVSSEDPVNVPIRWVKDEDTPEDEGEVTFSITGNFNSWEEDRLAPGDVAGQFVINITVPDNGILEFRFFKDGDTDKVICPAMKACMRKTAPIIGPAAGLTNTWMVTADPDSDIQIELFYTGGKYSLVWFKV